MSGESDEDRLSELLNSSTPHAPNSDEEARGRLRKPSPAEPAPENAFGLGRRVPVAPLPSRPDRELEELQNLAAELQEFTSLIGGTTDPGGSYSASDGSGSVRVTVDGTGAVSRLTLRQQWRSALRPEGLGAAVVEALGAATRQRLEGWVTLFDEQERKQTQARKAGQQRRRPDFRRPAVPAQVPSLDRTSLMNVARQIFDESDQRIQEAKDALGTPKVVTDGHVEVTVSGGAVSGIAYDVDWVSRARDASIADETVRAIGKALQDAQPEAVKALNATVREIDELVQMLFKAVE
ncbi:hypothetical protein GCM10027589_23320 [Actinocorallia lasiicapitis]